jgi:hypothetical protein
MDVSVSNLQILGAIDGLRARIEALTTAVQGGGGMAGGASGDAMDCDGGGAVAAPKIKRRRAKSKYNDHMSEELARLKVKFPDLGHRRRFAMAVQSWKDILAAAKADAAGAADDVQASDPAEEGVAEKE